MTSIYLKYLLRNGTEADRQALQTLLENNQMEVDINPAEFLLAEINGELAGAARLEHENSHVYLRPVVVDSKWHGKNIGSALIRSIAQGVDMLYVVSRGKSTGFYQKLGFLPIPWEQVPERYRQECNTCPDLGHCQPIPMVLSEPSDV